MFFQISDWGVASIGIGPSSALRIKCPASPEAALDPSCAMNAPPARRTGWIVEREEPVIGTIEQTANEPTGFMIDDDLRRSRRQL